VFDQGSVFLAARVPTTNGPDVAAGDGCDAEQIIILRVGNIGAADNAPHRTISVFDERAGTLFAIGCSHSPDITDTIPGNGEQLSILCIARIGTRDDRLPVASPVLGECVLRARGIIAACLTVYKR
jgi:hypothetical protein